MLSFSGTDLKALFSNGIINAKVTYTRAKLAHKELDLLGIETDLCSEDELILAVYNKVIKDICLKLTSEYQGLGRDALDHKKYLDDFLKTSTSTPGNIDVIAFTDLSKALDEDAKALEQKGIVKSAELLVNTLFGYDRNQVKRSKTEYLCTLVNSNHSFEMSRRFEELKKQLTVALSTTCEEVSLQCFDDYRQALDKVDHSHEVSSRSVYGSKSDRIYITHYKEKVVIHFSPFLYEAIVAFALSCHPDQTIDFELPVAA